MTEQRAYLSKNHQRLLSIAGWAKYVAWLVLAVFAIGAIMGFFGSIAMVNAQLGAYGRNEYTFARLLRENAPYALNVVFAVLRTFFQGLVYFLILRGISVGLSMIVETDINYRDRAEGAQ